jgi:signal transduction histidine kinase
VIEPTELATAIHLDGLVARPSRRRTTLEPAVVAAMALALGALVPVVASGVAPGEVLTLLVAAALACLAVLLVARAPSLAWLAAIGAGSAGSSLFFAWARALEPGRDASGGWVVVAAAASLWAIATASIAAGYATRPGRLDPIALPVSLGLVAWLVVGCATTVGLVLAGQHEPDPAFTWVDVAIVPLAWYLPVLAVLVALGAGADVRAARNRARRRLASAAGGSSAERAWLLGAATLRELQPGQAAAVEAARSAERTRIAGDLHAAVLPTLRRAIVEAEAGGDPDLLARRLRTVDRELERLMADRWPVVLEAFGLVAALEDLAERLEADGAATVTIDVERTGDRPPAAVERAAWRFAQITLDNAERHAAATTITLDVAVDVAAVRLVVTDDGIGIGRAGETRPGARGLADAVDRAREVGAVVAVEAGPSGGTRASFAWERPVAP